MKNLIKLSGFAIATIFCCSINNAIAQGQGQGQGNQQGLWTAEGQNIVKTNRFVRINNNMHVLRDAYIDSLLTAFSVQASYLATQNLLVTGISQFNGLVNFGSTITIDGIDNTISSSSGKIDFLNSNLFTSGNIQADTVKAQVAQFSKSSNITGTLNVQGEFHLLGNAFIDSILTALSIKTNYLETENILVTGISQFNGLVNINSNLISTGDITSTTVNTDTVQAQVGRFSKSSTVNGILVADTIQASIINGSTIFQNGSPIFSSQWLSLDSNIYFSTGSVFVKDLFVEKSVNIGGFRFTNGAEQQQKDSISSTAEIVITSQKEKILLESDTVLVKNRLGIGVSKAEASLDVSGDAIVRGWLYVQDGVVIGKSFEGQKAIIDSIRSERMESKEIQAETVKAQTLEADTSKIAVTETDTLTAEKIKAGTIVIDGQNNTISCESINANSISLIDGSFDSLNIFHQLKIGNSIYISGIIGASNIIYGTDKVISFLGGGPGPISLEGETRNIKQPLIIICYNR